MNNSYLSSSFLEVEKSKFYAFLIDCNNLDQFKNVLDNLKKEYKKATHFCFAYIIKEEEKIIIKYSDANEPKGTVGINLFNFLQKNNLINKVLIVIRYFGGTKLGKGRLYRSYSLVALNCINNYQKEKNNE